ncbi:MAG: D-aminoacyl-tRNA deacylase, partial [Pyrinomonadaceae bacterium]
IDKIVNLRIFEDSDDRMILSLLDISGELLVVSQFTLYGDTRRGRRPSFIAAAAGSGARQWYEYFVTKSRDSVSNVATGRFGEMMDVELVNDGPVTIILDSEKTI